MRIYRQNQVLPRVYVQQSLQTHVGLKTVYVLDLTCRTYAWSDSLVNGPRPHDPPPPPRTHTHGCSTFIEDAGMFGLPRSWLLTRGVYARLCPPSPAFAGRCGDPALASRGWSLAERRADGGSSCVRYLWMVAGGWCSPAGGIAGQSQVPVPPPHQRPHHDHCHRHPHHQ